MKTPRAKWLTVHQSDIDQRTSIEVLWKTEPNTLNLLVFRISLGDSGTRPRLTTEEIGPCHSLAELHQQLCMLFGELAARHVCQHSSSWLLPQGYNESPGQGQTATKKKPGYGASARLRRADRACGGRQQTIKTRKRKLASDNQLQHDPNAA